MSDTPKFEVIDRRRMKAAQEEQEPAQKTAETPAAPLQSEPKAEHKTEHKAEASAGPRLVVTEGGRGVEPEPEPAVEPDDAELPPAPTAAESAAQKAAYEASSQRLEELVRAQNPTMGAQPPVGFEHLVQQFYLSAMMQMGAGTPEGQRPRIDVLGARSTIDLLGLLSEKTKGNLTENEQRMLETVLFDLRMAFLELTRMVSMQPPVPPPPGKI